jgi:hypothetical protein
LLLKKKEEEEEEEEEKGGSVSMRLPLLSVRPPFSVYSARFLRPRDAQPK